jgi:hypothetical protein
MTLKFHPSRLSSYHPPAPSTGIVVFGGCRPCHLIKPIISMDGQLIVNAIYNQPSISHPATRQGPPLSSTVLATCWSRSVAASAIGCLAGSDPQHRARAGCWLWLPVLAQLSGRQVRISRGCIEAMLVRCRVLRAGLCDCACFSLPLPLRRRWRWVLMKRVGREGRKVPPMRRRNGWPAHAVGYITRRIAIRGTWIRCDGSPGGCWVSWGW